MSSRILSGPSRAAPNTGKPPASASATVTSIECENPKIGTSIPSRLQSAVLRELKRETWCVTIIAPA